MSYIRITPLNYGLMALLFLITSCTIDNEAFTPSHTEGIELTERADGDFDTPVDITYKDPNGKIWTAPKGTITDGASIPNLFTSFFGGKLNKKHLFAAIVHDAYCGRANKGHASYQTESWEDTHHMFYHACISNGRSVTKAGTMYAAVRLGGPRWPFKGAAFVDLSGVDEDLLKAEMKSCESWIKSKGDALTLEEIDQWMEEREQALLEGRGYEEEERD